MKESWRNFEGRHEKIKILQDIERESYHTGEMMGWSGGQFEVAYVHTDNSRASVDWG